MAGYGSDYLVILGSGGGRYHATNQRRSTGGLILGCNNRSVQIHIDPGPGAIRDLKNYKINPRKTDYVFLTHAHTDHNMSIPIILEALQRDFHYRKKSGILVAPSTYLETDLPQYYQKIVQEIIPVEEHCEYVITPWFKVETKHTAHDRVQNVGYIFELGSRNNLDYHYRIGFTSDTASFPEFIDEYRGVDVLVANLLRPDNVSCRGHFCTDEFIPLLTKISPKICILVHLGGVMDNHDKGDQSPTQLIKIQTAVGDNTKVIMGRDGLKIVFSEHTRI